METSCWLRLGERCRLVPVLAVLIVLLTLDSWGIARPVSVGFQGNPQHNGFVDAVVPSSPFVEYRERLCSGRPNAFAAALAAHGKVVGLLTDTALIIYVEDETHEYPLQREVLEIPGGITISNQGTIYVSGTGDSKLRAISSDGDKIWSFVATNENLFLPVLASRGGVYVLGASTSASGLTTVTLHAIAATGQEVWHYDVSGSRTVWAPSVAEDGTVYVAIDETIHAIRANGEQKWETSIGAVPQEYLVVDKDGFILCSTDSNELVALDRRGRISWRFSPPDPYVILSPPVIGREGRLYIPVSEGRPQVSTWGTLALDARRQVDWFFPAMPMAVDAQGMLIAQTELHGWEGDHAVYCLSPNGEPIWEVSLEDDAASRTVIGSDGRVLIPAEDGLVEVSEDSPETMLEIVLAWVGEVPSNDEIAAAVATLSRRFQGAFGRDSARALRDQVIVRIPLAKVSGKVQADHDLGEDSLSYFALSSQSEAKLQEMYKYLLTEGKLEFYAVKKVADPNERLFLSSNDEEVLHDASGEQYLVWRQPLLSETRVCKAAVQERQFGEADGTLYLDLTLDRSDAYVLGQRFDRLDSGDRVAIALDGLVLSAAMVTEAILDALSSDPYVLVNAITISPLDSRLQGQLIARVLQAGSLPTSLRVVRYQIREREHNVIDDHSSRFLLLSAIVGGLVVTLSAVTGAVLVVIRRRRRTHIRLR